MTQTRGVEGIRVLQGLKALASKHAATALDEACETALAHGAWRLRTIREMARRYSHLIPRAPDRASNSILAESGRESCGFVQPVRAIGRPPVDLLVRKFARPYGVRW